MEYIQFSMCVNCPKSWHKHAKTAIFNGEPTNRLIVLKKWWTYVWVQYTTCMEYDIISYALLESGIRLDIQPKSSTSHKAEPSGISMTEGGTFQQGVTNLSPALSC